MRRIDVPRRENTLTPKYRQDNSVTVVTVKLVRTVFRTHILPNGTVSVHVTNKLNLTIPRGGRWIVSGYLLVNVVDIFM